MRAMLFAATALATLACAAPANASCYGFSFGNTFCLGGSTQSQGYGYGRPMGYGRGGCEYDYTARTRFGYGGCVRRRGVVVEESIPAELKPRSRPCNLDGSDYFGPRPPAFCVDRGRGRRGYSAEASAEQVADREEGPGDDD